MVDLQDLETDVIRIWEERWRGRYERGVTRQDMQQQITWILVTWWPYCAVVGTLATISAPSASNRGALSFTSAMLTRTITSPSPDPSDPSPSM